MVTRSPGLPSLLSSAPTEDVQKEEREANKWVGCMQRPACIGQGHSFPSGEDSFLEVPPLLHLHLFALTPLYVRFHLKAPTKYLETEMDWKTGRGRESRAVCQNSGGMLTAAVCANISMRRQRKMAILKDDRKEDMGGKDDPFYSIKASNVI